MKRRSFLRMFSGFMAAFPLLRFAPKSKSIDDHAEQVHAVVTWQQINSPGQVLAKFPVYLRSPIRLVTEAGQQAVVYRGAVVRAEDEVQLQYWRAKGYTFEDDETTAIRQELAAKWRMDSDLA